MKNLAHLVRACLKSNNVSQASNSITPICSKHYHSVTRHALIAVTITSLLMGLFGSNLAVFAASNAATDRFIIQYKNGIPATTMGTGNSGKVVASINALSAQVVSVPHSEAAGVLAAYRSRGDVVSIEPDYIASVADVPNDPYFSQQWGMTKIKAPDAWSVTRGNSSIKIAILDTGIDLTHPDLMAKIVASQNFSSSTTVDDLYGHGSHTAGIAAASIGNGIGVAGVGYNCSLMNVKVMDDSGSGYYSSIENGIIWAADNGANVISMSLGGGSDSSTLQQAVDYAWNKGVVVVAAAGNSASSSPSYPAYYTNCIAVAATDPNDALYSFSNYGDWVDVAAPGNAYSTYLNGGYATMYGTSMSTPHVAGLAGLVFSVATDTNGNGRLNDEVRSLIEANCDNIGVSGIGHGRINAYKAVSAAVPPVTTGTISGNITDAAMASPVTGASVSDGTRTATSDTTGSYTISNVPAGNYTVTATASGYSSASKTVTVTAGAAATANFSLSTIPVNHPPVINPIGNQTVNEGALLQFTVTASDPDGDPLTYSASNLPSGATFDTGTHIFSWTPAVGQAGIYSGVTFSVSDGKSTTSQSITITVNKVVIYGQVSGTVTNAANGTAIAGATVSDGTRSATTSSSGVYTLANVPAGNYTVTVNATGYVSASKAVTVISGATSTLNFTLTKAVVANTMWVDSITFTSSGSYITARVKVVNPQPVSGARVSINVYYNGRNRWAYSSTTSTTGEAVFRIYAGSRGIYTINVTQLSYSGYKWDTTKGVKSATYTR